MNSSRLITRRAWFAFPAAAALALAACGSDDGDPDSASGGNANIEDADAELQFIWPGTSDPEMRVAEDFQADLNEDNPNLKLEYNFMSWGDMQDQLAIRIQAGNPPDLTMTQDVLDLVRMQGLEPLRDRLEGSDLEASEFRPGTLEYSTVDGELYAVPYLAQAFTLVVNEELLAEAGMAVEDLKTWADMEAAAEAMTTEDTYGFAYPMGNPRFAFRVPMTAAYSNDLLMNDTSPEAEQQWRELLDHFEAMRPYRPAADVTWDYADMFRAYANGEVGMIAAGTFFTPNVYELNPQIIDVSRQIAYPAGPSAEQSKAPVMNVGYGIFAGGQNPDLSWNVLERLVDDEWVARQASVVHVPARTTVGVDAIVEHLPDIYPEAIDGQTRQIEDMMALIDEGGVAYEPIPGQPEMEPEVQEIMRTFNDGSIDADEAYALLMERIGEVKDRQ
ncbi:extracellular solute-binding protein [Phytoactinopolyspora alkaliphila]|uniref:Extracellular solute-binding protein n=1 Tax=Phytoactinopolyspora alkaliphila TaxID=1783498 RepID=A0A6N9YTE6_9ACTN|nr:extracellular solute-binding protein [Phytoactinopolyspora alkaliphila]NED98306.1 extracellular solute-binding protein [Phytoactinopolyspora alkaliphila]